MNSWVAFTIQKEDATGLFTESQVQGFVVVAFIEAQRPVSAIGLIPILNKDYGNLVTQPMYNGRGVVRES